MAPRSRGARCGRGIAVGASLLASLGAHASQAAAANPAPSVDVRTWTPTGDPRAGLVLEPASSPGPWSFATTTWMHYENDSVTLRIPSTGALYGRPVENLLGLDVMASLGLGARALVGVGLPVLLAEQGTGVPTTVVSGGRVPASGFGDLALVGKGTLKDNERGGLGLAALGAFTLPTGTATSFASDASPTVSVRVLADYSILIASFQASLGYTLRTSQVAWPTGASGGVVFGDSIPWTLGFVVRPALLHPVDPDGRQTWELALHGSLPAGPVGPFGLGQPGSAEESPVLLALSDRIALGRYKDGFLLAGVDVGLDHAVGVPTIRATIGVGLRLDSHDRDGDGIPDDRDQCPRLAEDHDGYQDADGCPDADNDDDGIVDQEDACPNVPGVRSADPRKNGCPAAAPQAPPAPQ